MSEPIEIIVNGEHHEIDARANMLLLGVVRDRLKLTGTRFGCGQALCGACTVHLDGRAIRSCITPIAAAAGREITTIEGLGEGGLHPVQEAWLEHRVPQCGFCQSGQIMSAAALLESNPDPSDEAIDAFMSGNICRCGTYMRIREAIKTAAKAGAAEGEE